MHADALNSANYVSFNVTAAHNLGLENAIYCSELISIYNKAKKKNKLKNEYFTVDRKYLEYRTTLNHESQLRCDASLRKVGILEFSDDEPNTLKFNSAVFAQAITSDDALFLKRLSKATNQCNVNKEAKKIKRNSIAKVLKDSISTDNQLIRKSLERWIDVMMQTNRLTKESVIGFQTTLFKYAGDDVSICLNVLDIAIAQKYSNCIWAIDSFERGNNVAKNAVRKTNIEVANDVSSLSDKVY